MTYLEEIRNKLRTITKGRYHHMEWQSVNVVDGVTYKKISKGSVRFVDYYNLTGKERPADSNRDIIKISKNGNEYVNIFTTGKMPKCIYLKGTEYISKSDYEKAVKKSYGEIGIMFTKRLEDILVLD